MWFQDLPLGRGFARITVSSPICQLSLQNFGETPAVSAELGDAMQGPTQLSSIGVRSSLRRPRMGGRPKEGVTIWATTRAATRR